MGKIIKGSAEYWKRKFLKTQYKLKKEKELSLQRLRNYGYSIEDIEYEVYECQSIGEFIQDVNGNNVFLTREDYKIVSSKFADYFYYTYLDNGISLMSIIGEIVRDSGLGISIIN